MLADVNVALGVTGSIAAVRTVELAHELRRQGAAVRAITTDSAHSIVHPWALEFGTNEEVVTEITGAIEHVGLCGEDGWADVLLVAPATANTVGKIAGAIDDTPVTTCATTALGSGLGVVIAPAMHEPMYDHPGVLDAIDRVESWGVTFVDPVIEEGKAKMATDEAIVLETARAADDAPLDGAGIVVTSGATSEAIDPVRVLTSRASGATGRAVARACYVLGAEVTMVHDGGPVPYATVERVESAAEMTEAALEACTDADALVAAAAVSDYTVEEAPEKLRSGQPRSLDLKPTPKLIDRVREANPDLPIVAFKAESGADDEALAERAGAIKDRVGAALVVANDAGVMGEDRTRAVLVQGDVTTYEGDKAGLGMAVARDLAASLGES
jgi:phosphopantothenoylcysteine decarboxylase/phosphopantothenate--cysteine ligase